MIRITRIAYAVLETPDLERKLEHYQRVMGLTLVDREGDTAYLSPAGDHHTIVLRRSDEPRCTKLGFQIGGEGDLDGFANQTEGHGISVRRESDAQPAIADQIAFEDPKGTTIEVFRSHVPFGHGFARGGIVPNKLGHVAFNVTDVRATVDFYCRVLGFRESDWMADFFAFLRCGPDHHSINLVAGTRAKIHHVAFELRDWGHIKESSDLLAGERVPLVWGPVRHGIGHNISTYHRDPDGTIVELFTELDRISDEGVGTWEPRATHQSFPQAGKVWTDVPLAANMWGSPPPDGFLD